MKANLERVRILKQVRIQLGKVNGEKVIYR
jgi:hypothetical protein